MYFYRPLKNLRAITFDLDNTLYNNQPVIARTEYKSIQFLQQYHPALSCLGNDYYRQFYSELRQLEPEIYHDVSYWRWRSIVLAMRKAGLSKVEASIGADATMELFLYWRSQIYIPIETHMTLKALSTRWPLVAITNGNASPEACGLAKYFCYILRSGLNGRAKPYQDMYALASTLLSIPPSNILHVGDDLETDVNGAIQYGMQACWINNHGINFNNYIHKNLLPHMEISRLLSLTSLL